MDTSPYMESDGTGGKEPPYIAFHMGEAWYSDFNTNTSLANTYAEIAFDFKSLDIKKSGNGELIKLSLIPGWKTGANEFKTGFLHLVFKDGQFIFCNDYDTSNTASKFEDEAHRLATLKDDSITDVDGVDLNIRLVLQLYDGEGNAFINSKNSQPGAKVSAIYINGQAMTMNSGADSFVWNRTGSNSQFDKLGISFSQYNRNYNAGFTIDNMSFISYQSSDGTSPYVDKSRLKASLKKNAGTADAGILNAAAEVYNNPLASKTQVEAAVESFIDFQISIDEASLNADGSGSVKLSVTKAPEGDEIEDIYIIGAFYSADETLQSAEIVTKSTAELTKEGTEIAVPLGVPNGEIGSGSLMFAAWNAKYAPMTGAVKLEGLQDGAKIFIAGDSTAHTYREDEAPLTGWGQVLDKFIDTQKASIVNMAQGGRDSKMFYDETFYQSGIKGVMKKGDYLFIQFGHNDPKNGITVQEYKEYLGKYIDDARKAGVKPVILTSITRCVFIDGKINRDEQRMQTYVNAAKEVAAEKNVACIDMFEKSVAYLESIGAVEAAKLYMGERNDGKGGTYNDITHFNVYGAEVDAGFIRDLIRDSKHPSLYGIQSCLTDYSYTAELR